MQLNQQLVFAIGTRLLTKSQPLNIENDVRYMHTSSGKLLIKYIGYLVKENMEFDKISKILFDCMDYKNNKIVGINKTNAKKLLNTLIKMRHYTYEKEKELGISNEKKIESLLSKLDVYDNIQFQKLNEGKYFFELEKNIEIENIIQDFNSLIIVTYGAKK